MITTWSRYGLQCQLLQRCGLHTKRSNLTESIVFHCRAWNL